MGCSRKQRHGFLVEVTSRRVIDRAKSSTISWQSETSFVRHAMPETKHQTRLANIQKSGHGSN